ncbi:DUF7266 family protein [Haloarcula onubensis]|uniref:Fla cluster protein FlaF n=1 Tax=Haloarcula onubensis TaxID=2950539 RepID=A0ABU2FQG0_9EURY|nr:hypothetical protein [Halomicroarcula sp. S3CR25-11]MDS0282984.1 hypothetical protein [Halomicroarcula sp. S3CR25-11]
MSDARAVSTTLGYVLALAIATLLITGLIIAGGSYVDTQREQVIRDELTVVGQQLAADVERADRLVRAADTDSAVTVRVNRTFSNTVTGAHYRLTLVPGDGTLVLNTTSPDVTVRVPITNETALGASSARGGPVQIRYDGTDDHLEVRDV